MLTPVATAATSLSSFDALVLAKLRHANIRLRLALNCVNFAATSLRRGWTNGEDALAIVAEVGLLDFVTRESS